MWAYGFMRGIKLREKDWQPFLDDPECAALLRPIYLLGADKVKDEEELLVETAVQREALTKQIPASVAAIYRYWTTPSRGTLRAHDGLDLPARTTQDRKERSMSLRQRQEIQEVLRGSGGALIYSVRGELKIRSP